MVRKAPIKKNPDVSKWLHRSLKRKKFLGLSLGGGKTDKTSLAVLEYYPEHNKIFLADLIDKIKTHGEISADEALFQLIKSHEKHTVSLAIDVPLKLPKCIRCRLQCPGFEKCTEPEIQWLWKHYRQRNLKKKPRKLFTPYTERCVEFYVANHLEESFHPPHALGANNAPLTARAQYLLRRLRAPVIEVFPKLSLWRIGRSLGLQKAHLRGHTKSFGGKEARAAIMKQLVHRDIAFVYEQDHRVLTERSEPFDAYLCALTAVLKHQNQVEKRPKGFPRAESWIEIPKVSIDWPSG